MKRGTVFLRSTFAAAVLGAAALVPATTAHAQATGSVHGHVQNYAGQAMKEGEVRLSTDRAATDEKTRKYAYTFPVDATGNFKGSDVKPDDYVMFFFSQGKLVDYIDHVVIRAGEDKLADDDMTRPAFIEKLTPDEKKALEDFKKKNGDVVAQNAKVANINALLTKARDEMKANNYDAALADMQQAVAAKPDEGILFFELGNAQLGSKKYDDAVTSFQKAIDLNAAAKKPSVELQASASSQMGQAYARLNKPKDAAAAYDKAAQLEPAKAGIYYMNEAATLTNAGDTVGAGAAADKAIAADPTKADAYYVKGQSLIGQATLDPKSQKMVPPPGCLEAYEKYLDLAPNGKYAADVKSIIGAFDEKIVTSYRAGKKK